MSQTKAQLVEGFNINTSVPADSLVIDSSGRLLVGTSSSVSQAGLAGLLQIETTSVNEAVIKVRNNQNTGNGPFVALTKSRGTTIGSDTIVQSGDDLGTIIWFGADGTDAESYAAQITCQVDGTPGTNDMPGRLVFSTTADNESSPTSRVVITNLGATIFGTNRTSWAFNADNSQINSSGTFIKGSSGTGATTHCAFYNPNGQVGGIVTSGSATAYNTSSDYRLKENVTPVTDGITRLQQLKPSRFNFIADPGTVVDGFIAHEVQTVVPEAITGEKDAVDDEGNTQYQGIDQSKLVPLLTAALQEAIGEIESLKARVAVLESA